MGISAVPGSAGHGGRLEQKLPAIGDCTQQRIHLKTYILCKQKKHTCIELRAGAAASKGRS